MLMLRDISEVCSMIQRPNSYNLLTNNVTEKVSEAIYRPDKKKQKKYRGVTNELSIEDNIKALKYKSSLRFRTCQKKLLNLLTQLMQFTDQEI